jgi:hypothetical protein
MPKPAELSITGLQVAEPVGERPVERLLDAPAESDLPRRAFRRTRCYRLVLEPLGVTDTLDVAIPSPNWHSKRFSLDRRERDFSTRDLLVLDALQPHLARLWRAAEIRRRLRAAIAGLEQASEQDPARRRPAHGRPADRVRVAARTPTLA